MKYLLTLMLFQTSMAFFFSVEHKRWFSEERFCVYSGSQWGPKLDWNNTKLRKWWQIY